MQEYVEITATRKTKEGTELLVLVPDKNCIQKIKRFADGGHIQAIITLDDNRAITLEQLKKAHVLMAEIGTYLGYTMEWYKSLMKSWYTEVYNDLRDGFSMANMSVDQARRFINLVIEFAFEMEIPLRYEDMPSIVEIDGFLYLCLLKKRCAVCGKAAEIHHWDAIGLGRDRTKVDDSRLRKIALCREHHVEAHQLGKESFKEKYHVYGIYLAA